MYIDEKMVKHYPKILRCEHLKPTFNLKPTCVHKPALGPTLSKRGEVTLTF